ncbi:MAG: CPBP family intramembrane metalloprotease [Actinobacteria bacterium]|nr:CPBP family intramembrane metalloprotease [Actinomycetota bacterium]
MPELEPQAQSQAQATIPLRDAALLWIGAWLAGNLAAGAALGASGSDTVAEAGSGWLTLISLAQWVPMLVALWYLGRRFGVGRLVADYGFSFRAIDLVGVPAGVATQLMLVPLLYWPLESVWPTTFGREQVEDRARTLWESASGAGSALLVVVVVLGAPIVEELTYRGLLQGALCRRLLNPTLALVLAASVFALVHFEPVEYPGLMLVGLVLGAASLLTGRLGMSVLAHAAFNATGLLLVATS